MMYIMFMAINTFDISSSIGSLINQGYISPH